MEIKFVNLIVEEATEDIEEDADIPYPLADTTHL